MDLLLAERARKDDPPRLHHGMASQGSIILNNQQYGIRNTRRYSIIRGKTQQVSKTCRVWLLFTPIFWEDTNTQYAIRHVRDRHSSRKPFQTESHRLNSSDIFAPSTIFFVRGPPENQICAVCAAWASLMRMVTSLKISWGRGPFPHEKESKIMNIDYMIQILQETKEFMAHAYPLDVTSSGQTVKKSKGSLKWSCTVVFGYCRRYGYVRRRTWGSGLSIQAK